MTAHSMSQANPLNSLDAAHEMEDLIATSLNPIEPDPAMGSALSARLFQRVARSAQANAPFVNVRKRDGVWTESVPGVQVKLLHEGEGVVSRLIQLVPGAHWSLDAVAAADEILILSGDLDLGGIRWPRTITTCAALKLVGLMRYLPKVRCCTGAKAPQA